MHIFNVELHIFAQLNLKIRKYIIFPFDYMVSNDLLYRTGYQVGWNFQLSSYGVSPY